MSVVNFNSASNPYNDLQVIPESANFEEHDEPTVASHDIQLEPIEFESAAIEEEITTAWQNLKANWWKIHNDEDESDAKELKEAKKRMPPDKKQYITLVATILSSLGLQVVFRDEPIMKGTSGVTINAIKISYNQMQQGTPAKYVMRAVAIATLIAGITLYYVPEDPHGVIRILRAAPLTDMFMTVFLKCDLSSARLDLLLNRVIKKCTNRELPDRVAKAITKTVFTLIGGGMMNIPQVSPFIKSAAAVLTKANMRGVVDTLFQKIDSMPRGIQQKAVLASVITISAAGAAASAYALTEQIVRQSSFSWGPAAALVVFGDLLARLGKNAAKTCEIPKEYQEKIKAEIKAGLREAPPPAPWWRKCLTVASGIGLVGATLGIAYVVGPSTLSSSASSSVTNNSGILTTVCQEMSSLLKIASGKLLPDAVALFGSVGMLTAGAGYHLYETLSGMTTLLTPVQRATGAAFLAATMGVAGYELKDYLRAEKKPKIDKAAIPLIEV